MLKLDTLLQITCIWLAIYIRSRGTRWSHTFYHPGVFLIIFIKYIRVLLCTFMNYFLTHVLPFTVNKYSCCECTWDFYFKVTGGTTFIAESKNVSLQQKTLFAWSTDTDLSFDYIPFLPLAWNNLIILSLL